MKTLLFYILMILLFLTFTSCSSRKIQKDMSAQEDPQVTSGRMIFKANCQKCHPNGDADFGPAIKKMNLPKYVIRVRVRTRGFLFWTGKMPSFNKHEISKKELNDLVEYVKFMQAEYKKEKVEKKN